MPADGGAKRGVLGGFGWLPSVTVYSFLDVGPSTELVHLIAKCMDVSADPFVSRDRDIPAKNYEAWDRAVQFEGGSEPDTTGKHPSTAAVNAVAKAAFPSTKGDHRKTIMSWRTHEKYQSEVAATRECIKIGLINKE